MTWDEQPDEEWVEDDASSDDDLMQCPSCGAAVHEDAQQCPECGDWIMAIHPRAQSRPMWWILLIVLLALSMFLFI